MMQERDSLRQLTGDKVLGGTKPPVLRVDNVTKEFIRVQTNERVLALKDVSFTISEGEFVSVIGRSGCGKSTLLRMVAGLLPPTNGTIYVDGKASTGPGVDRGMVFQEYAIFPWKTAFQNVEFPLVVQGVPASERHERVMHFLNIVNLTEAAERYPRELSGGMKQRVAVARGLCQNPRVLLMDEPFAAIDAVQRQQLQEDLHEICAKLGTTVMFVTHSVDEAAFLSDRIIVLKSSPGQIIAEVSTGLNSVSRRWADIAMVPEFNELRGRLLAEIQKGSTEASTTVNSGGLS